MHTLVQLQSGALKGAVSLNLSEELSHFPREIFELADTLEVLDLSRNKLAELPADMGRLKKLRILFCSENQFTVLPEVLADCPLLDIVGFKANQIAHIPARALNPNLRWLILTDNEITKLPDTIGGCARMQKLMLAGNRLSELPEALSQCSNLGLLRISANRLEALPEWLLRMPRLGWLAFSGNVFSRRADSRDDLPFVGWHELHLHELLGEGASGVIYKGTKHYEAEPKEVAVKIFKGAVTSDGLPEDEMNTFIAAGRHAGLVPVIGQIAAHPDGKKGLVMELVGAHYRNLGLPPSFESCTRDVFTPGAALSATQALKIAATIASVANQLHRNGIMHGDLYAHNTLVDDKGNTLLGDFGAASMYETTDERLARSLERIEVYAFGCLLDDLVFLCGGHEELEALRNACMAPDVLSRPAFEELDGKLANMAC